VIQKFHNLPPDRKQLLKAAMQRPCSWCEKEFQNDTGGGNIGKSHGVCRRHMVDIYRQMGKPAPASTSGGSFDLSTISPDERKLLGLLFAVIKRRQKEKGTF
jgi:hypothetical protein